ncbi:MAG: sensor histidine kinase [Bacteroidota bacterium]
MPAMSNDSLSYSDALKGRFIFFFGAIGFTTTTTLLLYLLLTDPFADLPFFIALCVASPTLGLTTYFAYKKKPFLASSLAMFASFLGCVGGLNLLFPEFITLMMIFVLSAMFISIRKGQMILFYTILVMTVTMKILVEWNVLSLSFIRHSNLNHESIVYISMFSFSIFSYALFVNFMINRGLLSSERLVETSGQLEETVKVKDRLIALISHDLKNPIGNIAIIVTGIQKGTIPVTPDILNMLNDTSARASKLIENLTQWSAVQQWEKMIRKEDFKLAECVEDTIGLLNIMSTQKKIEIVNNCDENAMINADRSMISTVIRNLLSNAIKFSNESSSIVVTTKSEEGFVKISITDSGVGLSTEQLNRLFQDNKDYYSRPGTRDEKGSGLGLIISKDFVKLNGGEIGVVSEEGKGSVFWFSIPVAAEGS